MASKQDDFQPFPVKDQLPGVDFCITSPPPWTEAILLGFQHYIVMLGTTALISTLLVQQMGGSNEQKAKVIQTLLFASGINTLLQLYFGTRLPTVIGGSHTYVLPTITIIVKRRYSYFGDLDEHGFKETMRAIQGALIIAGCFQIFIGFFGIWRLVMRYLSPLAAAPIVTLSGLGLYFLGFPGVARCIEVGLPELILLVVLSLYVPHIVKSNKVPFNRFAVLFSIAIIWVYAHILTIGGAYNHKSILTQQSCRTDRAGLIHAARWVSIPYPFQWGSPTFDAGEAFAMMAASFASLVESTGTLIAVQRFSSATPVPPSIFSRGVGWEGISLLVDGMLGTGTGSAASVENAGLLALTRVGSRRAIEISACFMICFSIFGKFGALFASIPMSIYAALYCVLFAYEASAGIGMLQFCHLNSFRSKFILGFSVFMGFSIPHFFKEYQLIAGHGPVHTGGRWFNDSINVIFSSPATVAGLIAYLLDSTLSRGDAEIRRERGWHWWEKFRSYKTDSRSEEFYCLPYNLSKYFPSI